jgi:hypothetical protein
MDGEEERHGTSALEILELLRGGQRANTRFRCVALQSIRLLRRRSASVAMTKMRKSWQEPQTSMVGRHFFPKRFSKYIFRGDECACAASWATPLRC